MFSTYYAFLEKDMFSGFLSREYDLAVRLKLTFSLLIFGA
jgi:hypothetical protein